MPQDSWVDKDPRIRWDTPAYRPPLSGRSSIIYYLPQDVYQNLSVLELILTHLLDGRTLNQVAFLVQEVSLVPYSLSSSMSADTCPSLLYPEHSWSECEVLGQVLPFRMSDPEHCSGGCEAGVSRPSTFPPPLSKGTGTGRPA